MFEHPREHDHATAPQESDAKTSSVSLDSIVVSNDDEPDECTLYPREATGIDLMTRWMTAREGSYVDLESAR